MFLKKKIQFSDSVSSEVFLQLEHLAEKAPQFEESEQILAALMQPKLWKVTLHLYTWAMRFNGLHLHSVKTWLQPRLLSVSAVSTHSFVCQLQGYSYSTWPAGLVERLAGPCRGWDVGLKGELVSPLTSLPSPVACSFCILTSLSNESVSDSENMSSKYIWASAAQSLVIIVHTGPESVAACWQISLLKHRVTPDP